MITLEQFKKLYSNKNRVEKDGYCDLATTVAKYKKAGLDIAKYKGQTRYDTLIEKMTFEKAPIRKFRYDKTEIIDRDKEWNQNLAELKKGIAEKMKANQEAKEKARLDELVQKELIRREQEKLARENATK